MTSKIKVDNIENQCGGAVVTKCGATTTIAGTNVNATTVTATNVVGSTAVKSNAIQASDGGNLVSQCGTTITLGASGDTISLASGASQTGFGRTGTVDWDTTPKTATFSAVSGNGYFCNTSGGAFTVNLPAGSAGAIVSFADYTRTFQTNNLTITPNGSEKIGGAAANLIASTEGQSITLVYVDATEGWINTAESTGQAGLNPTFITATGGTITCSGDYKIHTFTGPGTFTVCSVGNPIGSNTVDYLVVAGGGGGGKSQTSDPSGGGGAGGYRESSGTASGSYTVSPLGACVSALPVSVQPYPITVGGGGGGSTSLPNTGSNGSNSIFSSITSAGGGGGASGHGYGGTESSRNGNPGGSGGGAGYSGPAGGGGSAGLGNQPPVSPPQGNPGDPIPGADGGSALSPGSGNGATSSINASPIKRANGADGGNPGGPAGAANTGNGGGAVFNSNGNAGGSGIVIIRYKFQ